MGESMQHVLFVFARPGDESMLAGGTIRALLDSGSSVTVLTATLVEHAPHESPEALAAREARAKAELRGRLSTLGAVQLRLLGHTDARAQGKPARRYLGSTDGAAVENETLATADFSEVAADVAAAIIAARPDVVVTYAPAGHNGLPDTTIVHEATRAAADELGRPLFVVDGRGAVESFVRVRAVSPAAAESGLATRIATGALALGLGFFSGAMLTMVHQSTVVMGGFALPWGVIAALVITAALIAGLRVVFQTRIVAGLAAVGLLVAGGLLALPSFGGSVLIPATPAGYIWTFGPALITLVVLAWPQVRPVGGGKIGVVPASKGSDHS